MTIIKYCITEFYKISSMLEIFILKNFNSANKKNNLVYKNNQTSISFF